MPSFKDFLTCLCHGVLSFVTWLARSFRSIGHSARPESCHSQLLPVAIPCPQPAMDSSPVHVSELLPDVAEKEQPTCGPPKPRSFSYGDLERTRKTKEQTSRKATYAERSKPHSLSCGRLDELRTVHASLLDHPADAPMPGVYHLPSLSPSVYHPPTLVDSGTPSPLVSPSPSPTMVASSNEDDWVDHCKKRILCAQKFEAEIGALGRRRGFTGPPLFINRKSSSLLSLPPIVGPRIPRAPTSPRTPLEAVTNMIRGTSNKPVKFLISEINQDLQEFYDQADPFAMSGDTFFTPSVSFGLIATANLDNFSPYLKLPRAIQRDPSRKRKASLDHLRINSSTPIKRAPMKTTIYDLSVSDVPLKPISLPHNLKAPERPLKQSLTGSPKIVLTLPSAPSTPTKRKSCASSVIGMSVVPEFSEGAEGPSKASSEMVSDIPTALNLYDLGAYKAQPSTDTTPLGVRRVLADIRNTPRSTISCTTFESKTKHAAIDTPKDAPRQSIPEDIMSSLKSLPPPTFGIRTQNTADMTVSDLSFSVCVPHMPLDLPTSPQSPIPNGERPGNPVAKGLEDESGSQDLVVVDGSDPFAYCEPRKSSYLRPLVLPARYGHFTGTRSSSTSTHRIIPPVSETEALIHHDIVRETPAQHPPHELEDSIVLPEPCACEFTHDRWNARDCCVHEEEDVCGEDGPLILHVM